MQVMKPQGKMRLEKGEVNSSFTPSCEFLHTHMSNESKEWKPLEVARDKLTIN